MVVTCTLSEVEAEDEAVSDSGSMQETGSEKHVKGTATCTHCGNEADMWIDI